MKIEIGKELLIIKSENMRFFAAVPISKAREVLESAASGTGEVRYDGRAIALKQQTIKELQEKLGHTASAEQVQQKLKELEDVELANFEAECRRRLKSHQNEIRRRGNVEALAMLSRMVEKSCKLAIQNNRLADNQQGNNKEAS